MAKQRRSNSELILFVWSVVTDEADDHYESNRKLPACPTEKLEKMRMLVALMVLSFCGLTVSCKSKPIESRELVGAWDVVKRWGKDPMTGSIIFRADGTCETIKFPWGIVTGEEADFAAFESIKGTWSVKKYSGNTSVWIDFDNAKSTGKGHIISINPELRSGKWTIRQYIGDPDLMDIVEFHKR